MALLKELDSPIKMFKLTLRGGRPGRGDERRCVQPWFHVVSVTKLCLLSFRGQVTQPPHIAFDRVDQTRSSAVICVVARPHRSRPQRRPAKRATTLIEPSLPRLERTVPATVKP